MIIQLGLFILGLVSLAIGADWLVTGTSSLAEKRGVNPLLLGLTVVAFGTSAPELVVSFTAVLQNREGLAVGNVMGSTIANVGLIVGIAALIRPITVHRRLIEREGPLLIFVLAIVVLLSWNEMLGRLEGLALMTGFAIYLASLIRWGMKDENRLSRSATKEEASAEEASATVSEPQGLPDHTPLPSALRRWKIPPVPRIVAGLALLLIGAQWLVQAAVAGARHYNVSEEIIGATVVAVGTSIPELASTVAAAVRRLGDIAVGNVIGSNIFNLGLVLGGAAMIKPLPLSPITVGREVIPALIFSVALLPIAYSGSRITRAEGVLLLTAYGLFVVWLV
ncbi:MAG: calcium/sodium antiporter [Gemmatimonadota bacterium]